MHVRPSAVLWYSSFQVESDIHGDVVLAFCDGFLNIFFRLLKCEPPSYTAPPFDYVMVQAVRSLQYLRCLLNPSPMSLSSTIRWFVGILGSLMHTLYKYSRLVPSI